MHGRKGTLLQFTKKGSKTDAGNYRPVSPTSVQGKVMESFVDHMTKNTLFCEAQHGFVPGRSCMTQLLITLELWTEILDRGVSLDCSYLDFKKAFDSVPHERQLSKRDAYGIGGPLKAWTKDFLLDRKQRVVVNGKLSSWSLILSGIPQGSVLGPILFVILINDLPDQIRSTVKIFAYDTKIFRALHEPEDYSYLQDDLDRLVEWSQLWQLHFNDSKCKVLHMGNSNPSHCYTVSNIPLTKTAEEKDLGVIMDNELKFHTAYAIKKASKMLRLFRAIHMSG